MAQGDGGWIHRVHLRLPGVLGAGHEQLRDRGGGQGEGVGCRGVTKEEVKSKEDYLDYFCNGGVRTKLIVLAALLPELGPVLEQRVEGVVAQRACAGGVELGFSDLVVVGVEMVFSNGCIELVLIMFSELGDAVTVVVEGTFDSD